MNCIAVLGRGGGCNRSAILYCREDRLCSWLQIQRSRVHFHELHNGARKGVNVFDILYGVEDRLCGLVVRYFCYISKGSGLDSRRDQMF
jgi:hypothetical protein